MKKLLLLAMVVVLAGCGTTSGYWAMKPDQTKDQYWKDREECNCYAIDQTLRGSGVKGYRYEFFGIKGQIEKKHFDQCMEQKGYNLEVGR